MAEQFYHNLITQKSFEFLQGLNRKFKFILIGGWAVFLYSHNLKSKDIDIIVKYEELAELKQEYDIFKNDRLKKYEIKAGAFDIDVYLPHYSELGVDLEFVLKNTRNKEGFVVPELEILFLLKLFAWQNRQGSTRGHKDELDILSLVVMPEFDWLKYKKFVKESRFENYHSQFLDFLKKTTKVKELNINEQKMAKIKRDILKALNN